MQGTQGDDCPLRGLGREEFDGPADGDVHAWERAATATATATGTASVAANADGSNRSNGPDGPGATASTWGVSGRKHGSDVRMQILFTGTDNDEQSCALLISLPSFFFFPPPCHAVALVDGGCESTSPLLFFLYFPTFCSLLGAVSLVVLSSTPYRNDTIIFICLAKSTAEVCHSRGGRTAIFPFTVIAVTAPTVEERGQPISLVLSFKFIYVTSFIVVVARRI